MSTRAAIHGAAGVTSGPWPVLGRTTELSDRLARLFALTALEPPIEVTEAACDGGKVRLGLASDDGTSVTLILEVASPEARAYVTAGEFLVSYAGTEIDTAADALLRAAAVAIGEVPADRLAAALHEIADDAQALAAPRRTADGPRRTRMPTNADVDRLPQLLGLAPPEARMESVQLVAAEWWGHELVMEIEGPELAPFVAVLAPREAVQGFLAMDHLTLCHEGDDVTAEQAAFLTEFAERHRGLTFDALREAMIYVPRVVDQWGVEVIEQESSGAGGCGSCAMSAADPGRGDDAVTRAWRGARQWYRFFASAEIQRLSTHSVDFANACVSAEHGDLECRFAAPRSIAGVNSFVAYPWRSRSPQEQLGREGTTHLDFLTNLDDADVVLGGTDKLRRMLDTIQRHYPESPVHVNCTCPPIVIADEVSLAIREFRQVREAPVVFTTQDPGNPIGEFCAFIAVSVDQADVPDPTAVNLVGFGEEPSTDELIALLDAAGVRTNVVLLPHNRPELIAEYGRAGVQVLYPNGPWFGLYRRALEHLPLKTLRHAAPFGVEGTRRWLQAVAATVGRDTECEAMWAMHMEDFLPSWEAAKRRASQRRLGIVVSTTDIARLEDPVRSMGVPLVAMLDEMGFGLDLIALDEGEAAARRAEALLDGPNRQRHRVTPFASREELQRALRASEATVFFSEFSRDWRLTNEGKAQFDLSYLDRGTAGALRSLRRLLDLSEARFYSRFSKYLARRGPNRGDADAQP